MKKAVCSLMVAVWLAGLSPACAESPELDSRIEAARRVLREAMAASDHSIPEELLAKAKAVAIYPRVINGAFVFGGRFGRGVVVARDAKGEWTPVAFSTIGGASFGLQIGGQATDIILVVLNDRGLDGLLSNNFTLGADAAVTAGPVGRRSQADTDLFLKAAILSYARNQGLFAGVALNGAVLTQDNNSNTAYYGRPVNSRDILQGGAVEAQPSSGELLAELEEYSKRWDAGAGRIYDRADTAGSKADIQGRVTSVDVRQGKIVVMDIRPAEQRTKGEGAEWRVSADPVRLTNLRSGDHVKVYLDSTGKEKRALDIVKVRREEIA